MEQTFLPSAEKLAIRILWTAFPLSLYLILNCLGLLAEPYLILGALLVFLTTIGVTKHLRLFRIGISIENDDLLICDKRSGKGVVFHRHLISNPIIYDKVVKAVFLNQAFYFEYQDSGTIALDLSLFDEDERIRLVAALDSFLPELKIVDTV